MIAKLKTGGLRTFAADRREMTSGSLGQGCQSYSPELLLEKPAELHMIKRRASGMEASCSPFIGGQSHLPGSQSQSSSEH